MNMLHTSLIQTALLALQQAGELQFVTKCGESIPHSGFFKTVNYLGSDKLSEFTILIYMTSKSPTGYGIQVRATAQVPSLLLTEHYLESFEEFEDEIDKDYSIAAYKATRKRQLNK